MPISRVVCAFAMTTIIGACAASAEGLELILGSMTYKGQPRTKLTKSPIGSTLNTNSATSWGGEWIERYQIQPDRSFEIVSRHRLEPIWGFDD